MKSVYFMFLMLFIISCAHHQDVRPGTQGVHKVELNAEEKEAGAREAISQAKHFCEERGLTAAFVDEKKDYEGEMDEDDYKMVKRASKAAQIVGGTVLGVHHRRSARRARERRDLGGFIGLGGVIADQMTGEGYKITMRFKCI